MMAAALPIIDLAFRHGHFTFADAQETATYFFWFAISLALWSAQAQYARAFYGAGNTLTPMVASTIIVVASLPVYRTLFYQHGVTGLVIASDIGILMHTLVLAWLLHRKKMVLLTELPWLELMKALATAVFAGVVSYEVAHRFWLRGGRGGDVISLTAVSLTWLAAVALGLWITRSSLPRDLRRKKVPATLDGGGESMEA
jgi:putative peptidoglycan lipid II flippase